ncbi:MAG TPA: AbrB/MazE/SpoVT family DNA-binding domain-containing protein [Gaiellaceae bacterium]|jgi:bifunctional DNA-binding transcriptional regulator/antitoxin component of YhaV-PrlF toxin-antitoxin module
MRTVRHKITRGGQVSVPADVRRRWGTSSVALEDHGDRLVVRPLPDDPVAAARGALAKRVPQTTKLRAAARRDEAQAARRRG